MIAQTIFWDVPPCSPLKLNGSFGAGRALLATDFMLVSCLAYSSTLKMEEMCFLETSVDFQRGVEYQILQSYITFPETSDS
jgi:hypothetical protein